MIDEVEAQLLEYINRKRRSFDISLDLRGTRFQLRVWKTLLKIPYGELWTYGEVAKRSGAGNGYRAVGQAVGSNPVTIIIPCHRVIARGGRLGGYGGGIELKKKLLEIEGSLEKVRSV